MPECDENENKSYGIWHSLNLVMIKRVSSSLSTRSSPKGIVLIIEKSRLSPGPHNLLSIILGFG